MPCGSCEHQCFRGTYRSIVRVTRIGKLGTMLAVSTLQKSSISSQSTSVASYCYLPSSPILVTLMMVAIRSSDTPVLTRATQRNIPEDGILHCHCRENLKSYILNRRNYCLCLQGRRKCLPPNHLQIF
jgi:hypothetical protein